MMVLVTTKGSELCRLTQCLLNRVERGEKAEYILNTLGFKGIANNKGELAFVSELRNPNIKIPLPKKDREVLSNAGITLSE